MGQRGRDCICLNLTRVELTVVLKFNDETAIKIMDHVEWDEVKKSRAKSSFDCFKLCEKC